MYKTYTRDVGLYYARIPPATPPLVREMNSLRYELAGMTIYIRSFVSGLWRSCCWSIRLRMNHPKPQEFFDIRHLAAFAALARCGSFTMAAQELLLTQSAVSHAIRVLEEAVKCRLVDRSSKRIVLTQAGEQLLPHVDRIFREMQAAREGLGRLSHWGDGRIRVGASASVCQYLLPGVLQAFRTSFPRCAICVEPGDYAEQLPLLREQRVDLAIVLEPSMQPDLAFLPLFRDELRFVVAPSHPWGHSPRAPRRMTDDETLILYKRSSCTSALIMEYCRGERLLSSNVIELGSIEAIKALVRTGLGVAILAPWVVRAEIEEGSLLSLPLGHGRLFRQWGVAHLKSRTLALGEESFLQSCRTAAESLAHDWPAPLGRAPAEPGNVTVGSAGRSLLSAKA